MLELFTWGTPNGLKPLLLLEELGVPFRLRPIDLTKGEQRAPAYLAINPNGKIPSLVDDEAGVTLFESGAILQYLAEKHGRFLPAAADARARTMAWLFFQVGAVGPMFGQAGHFASRGDDQAYAKQRFGDEVARLYGVLDRRLGEAPYLAGDEYTIADMATFFWVRDPARFGLRLEALPHVARWVADLAARPAVRRTLDVHFG